MAKIVAIPLEQGLFFNGNNHEPCILPLSQSLWSRDYFLMSSPHSNGL